MTARDIVDILIVAILIYLALIFIKRTQSFFIFNALLALLAVSYLANIFNLSLTRQLFQPLLTFFIVIFVIVFQREIRRFFDWFSLSGRNLSFLRKLSISDEVSSVLVRALETMAKNRIGAIIVLPGEYPLHDVLVEEGFPLDGKVSLPLLLSIFDDHSPGHDGAVIIKDHAISKFGVHLPLAENFNEYKNFGTRHRAALGITEHTDAMAIVVSEEKGTISLAEMGKLTTISDMEQLQTSIQVFLKENIDGEQRSIAYYLFIHNLFIKISSIVLALLLWFFFVFQVGVVTHDFVVPVQIRFLPQQYEITDTRPKNITVTLSGRDSDFSHFDQSQLKAIIDIPDAHEGSQLEKINLTNISHPSFLSLEKVSPQEISITISQLSQ